MTNNHSHPHAKGKDVVYVDVDDEITTIIEHVQATHERIVALVLPKRTAALQSIVNMKLLKRAGDRHKKHIVLITGEAGLAPLAGAAGVHVAKSLQSKPEIPQVSGGPMDTDDEESIHDQTASESDPAEKAMVGGSAVLAAAADDDPIELDNATAAAPKAAAKSAKPKGKLGSKFRVPNFNKFRSLLMIGGLVVAVLVGGIIWAMIALPKANIVIHTDSTALTASEEITLALEDNARLDADAKLLPAKSQSETRTKRKEVSATGQKNNGKKATGTVSMTAGACGPSVPADVPAGTGLTTNGKTFITQSKVEFTPTISGGRCQFVSNKNVGVTAQDGGAEYNVGAANFSVAGRSGVTAKTEDRVSGGTDEIVKIVTQQDIDGAKQQIEDEKADDVQQALARSLRDQGLFAIEQTYSTSTSDTETSAQPGSEADNVTVTQDVIYTMFGVKKDDLEKIIAASVATEIDPSRQTILDYGIDDATFTLQNRQDNRALIGVRATVIAGPDLDVEKIKEEVAGKKAAEARDAINEYPGVTDVEVSYGPFWVRAIPGNTSKISVTIEEPETDSESESEQSDSQDE